MKTINTLFIEDEKLLRTLFEDAIIGYKDEYAGYDFKPEAVPDMKTAMEYLDTKDAPDVIILDLRLPSGTVESYIETPEKENGFTILKKIRSDAKFRDVPVIVFTNLSDEQTERESRALGADAFLIKSEVLPVDLLGTITKLVK
ncbi:MAG: response regulator [Candidatus Colwellbacteria bacterium]|nr:response regulator [Candidatus Colwellbacteria bacterium]